MYITNIGPPEKAVVTVEYFDKTLTFNSAVTNLQLIDGNSTQWIEEGIGLPPYAVNLTVGIKADFNYVTDFKLVKETAKPAVREFKLGEK